MKSDDKLIVAWDKMAGKFMMKTISSPWIRFCIGAGILALCFEPVEIVRLVIEYLASARGAAN